jgi:hypothetical protein
MHHANVAKVVMVFKMMDSVGLGRLSAFFFIKHSLIQYSRCRKMVGLPFRELISHWKPMSEWMNSFPLAAPIDIT